MIGLPAEEAYRWIDCVSISQHVAKLFESIEDLAGEANAGLALWKSARGQEMEPDDRFEEVEEHRNAALQSLRLICGDVRYVRDALAYAVRECRAPALAKVVASADAPQMVDMPLIQLSDHVCCEPQSKRRRFRVLTDNHEAFLELNNVQALELAAELRASVRLKSGAAK
jgi:hypothetical protein